MGTSSTAVVLATLVTSALGVATPVPAYGQSELEVSTAEFNQWMEEISNWGRWGEDDELGTLNLITNATRRAAAQLVRDGVSVSMALELIHPTGCGQHQPVRAHVDRLGVWRACGRR